MSKFYRFAWRVVRILLPLIWRLKVDHIERLNVEGAYIVSCNHIFWCDPVMVAVKSDRQIHFLGKNELFEKGLLRKVFTGLGAIPIHRGETDIRAVRNVLKALKQGKAVGVFPEGRRTGGKYIDEMHDGATFFALHGKCPIIPCGIAGSARFRGKFQLCVGEPMYFEEYRDKKVTSDDVEEATQQLSKRIHELAAQAGEML